MFDNEEFTRKENKDKALPLLFSLPDERLWATVLVGTVSNAWINDYSVYK